MSIYLSTYLHRSIHLFFYLFTIYNFCYTVSIFACCCWCCSRVKQWTCAECYISYINSLIECRDTSPKPCSSGSSFGWGQKIIFGTKLDGAKRNVLVTKDEVTYQGREGKKRKILELRGAIGIQQANHHLWHIHVYVDCRLGH